jgi:hypothetical protein
MRYDYHKELLNLRDQLFWRDKAKEIEEETGRKSRWQEIDVRYFDVTDELPSQYKDLMNLKLREVKEGYDLIVDKFGQANEELYKKVAVLDIINREGIKFD